MATAETRSIEDLQSIARRMRRSIVGMTSAANSGHPGGSLSCADILVYLYFGVMRHDPQRPQWPDRDRFVLSKGHVTPAYYAVLSEAGYIPADELSTFRRLGSRLQGHPVMNKPDGVEMSAGSLGIGLSFSVGQALAGRMDGRDYRTYCLLSDGDCNEGSTWEAALAAGHHRLDRLTAVVDYNHIQNDGFSDYSRLSDDGGRSRRVGGWVLDSGYTANIMSAAPMNEKWRSFGWRVLEADGHDFASLAAVFRQAGAADGRPTVLIAATTKGKGVSFMENNPAFHGKAASPEQLEQALAELAD